MLKKLSSLLKTRTGKLAEFDKLKARLDAVGGNGLEVAGQLGLKYEHTMNSAYAEWLQTKTETALDSYVKAKAFYQIWAQSNIPSAFHTHCGYQIQAIKNESGSRAILCDCLNLVGEAINADAAAIRAELQQAFAKVGTSLPDGIEDQPPLASLYRRGRDVTAALETLNRPVPLQSQEFDAIFALIESSALPVHNPTPAPAAPMGILESYAAHVRENAGKVTYGKSNAEQAAESQLAYMGAPLPIPAHEMEEVPGVGLVRRRNSQAPIMLEPVRQPDGTLLLSKSEHQLTQPA